MPIAPDTLFALQPPPPREPERLTPVDRLRAAIEAGRGPVPDAVAFGHDALTEVAALDARLRAGVAASVRYPPAPEMVAQLAAETLAFALALDGGRRP
jgi:hypothetical protein